MIVQAYLAYRDGKTLKAKDLTFEPGEDEFPSFTRKKAGAHSQLPGRKTSEQPVSHA
jgi:hypothetical protein